jgi:putative endonuclease
MRYVYLLQSEASADQRYVGITSDLKKRLAEHNAGKSPHTAKYTPWKLVTYVAFSNEKKAETFERYLKSGSGHCIRQKKALVDFNRRAGSVRLIRCRGNGLEQTRLSQASRL